MEDLFKQQLDSLSHRTDKLEKGYYMLDKSIALSAQNQIKSMELFEDVEKRLKILEEEKNKREGYRNIFKSILDKSYFVIVLIIIFAVLGLNNFVKESSHIILKHFIG